MNEREALRLALEALEYNDHLRGEAITAIKQALAQPEPVELAKSLALNLDGVIADVEQGDGFDDVCLDTIKFVRDALYTSPPKHEPLTDEQIEALRRSDDLFEDAPMWRLIARAIEAANGITGEQHGTR